MTTLGKKVLIVTYYWPPSGGSGVQRWLKFVKYLPQFGWEPHVFTPENPSFAIRDESLIRNVPDEAEVIRFPIWEPYELFFNMMRLFGKKNTASPTSIGGGAKQTFTQKLTNWIRGNFFVPDPRVFWVRPSVKYLLEYLVENRIQTIVTTGPPHSMHLIGLALKRKMPELRWIADFRDPWSEWGLLDSLHVGKWARRYHKRLETAVLTNADEVTTITPFYVRHFSRLGNRPVRLFTNGFDEEDFAQVVQARTSHFIIRHVGIINERCDPRPFMQALAGACSDRPDLRQKLKLEFVGEVHPAFRTFAEGSGLMPLITFAGNIPHQQLMSIYGTSSLLLLVLTGYKDAEGYMPGKLFEYLATGIPVLGVGPENGDAAALLKETGAGVMIDGENLPAIRKHIVEQFDLWAAGAAPASKKAGSLKYSRRMITGALSELLSLR